MEPCASLYREKEDGFSRGLSEPQRQGNRNCDPGRGERPAIRGRALRRERMRWSGSRTDGRALRGGRGLAPAVQSMRVARMRVARCAPPQLGPPRRHGRPPPRTRTLGSHTKGMARRAGRGAVKGHRAPDKVAGPRRPPRPRLCLPRSAPPAVEPGGSWRPHPARYPGE